ncbi:MAG TPA: hypothetical protein VIX14_14205 [Terriglobales bacterium]
MFASDDVVFAWAIGKAVLIVIVSVATLVYAAWAVTWQKDTAQLRIPEESALKYPRSVQADTVMLAGSGTAEEAEGARRIPARTSAEQINVPAREEPAAAA